jgi:hypothetical protein
MRACNKKGAVSKFETAPDWNVMENQKNTTAASKEAAEGV